MVHNGKKTCSGKIPEPKKDENLILDLLGYYDIKEVITDIARKEADLDTLKAGASLIPVAKITKVPKVVKAIGNVGKTGIKKGKEGEKTIWKRFTQEDKPKPDKNKGNQSKTGSKGDSKARIPRTNGKWKGEPGNGKWFSNNSDVLEITKGEGVPFKNGRPDFSKWKKGSLKFKEGVLDGSKADFNAVYDKIKQMKGFSSRNQAKNWLREKGLTPHHKSATEIELIPTKLHKNIPHIGSAADLRGGQ